MDESKSSPPHSTGQSGDCSASFCVKLASLVRIYTSDNICVSHCLMDLDLLSLDYAIIKVILFDELLEKLKFKFAHVNV